MIFYLDCTINISLVLFYYPKQSVRISLERIEEFFNVGPYLAGPTGLLILRHILLKKWEVMLKRICRRLSTDDRSTFAEYLIWVVEKSISVQYRVQYYLN